MKKSLLLALAAAATVAMPIAVQAAPYGNLNQREAQLQNQIDRSYKQGKLSRTEMRRLTSRLSDINRLENQYRRSGNQFTTRERVDISRRLDSLKSSIRYQKADRNDRNDRGDRNDQNDYGRNDNRGNWQRR